LSTRPFRLALAALVTAGCVSVAEAEGGPKPEPPAQQEFQPAKIDKNGVLILVRSTLIALDQANKTGNYTVLRDIAAPGFAVVNDPARLAEIFANLRRDKTDLSGILALEPQLVAVPDINANGMLHISGFFPSAPTQINFELLFAPVNGQWRMFGLGVNVGASAPTPPAAPPPAKKPEKKAEPAKN